ncbi:MAG: T9SS type A sorting domain-containing protein, partial [Ignavibacteriaceae bacterium]
GETAEQYALAISNSGKIGMAYNGSPVLGDDGDVMYRESTDNGLTWSMPIRIFDRPDLQDTAMGAIRGVDVNFYGEQPSVVFEICTQIFSSGNFFPGLPSEILFWSPIVNGGNSFAIADSFNVPFAPSVGTNDVQVPICRPVIGRSETGGFLFVAFDVATDDVFPSADPTTYFAGYFMLSSDGGNTWTVPEKFTPDTPLRDWRYISIAPINPVVGDLCTVHMVVQGDSLPGSTVNAAGMPVGVTAQYFHVSTEPITIPVELTSFTAQLINNQVVLNWQTATETNNMGFEIQRKLIQEDLTGEWIYIGYKEGAGTITEPQEYSYYDNIKNIEATSFVYRLKQVDYDGSYEFSNEITVENSTLPDEFSLSQNYPNPFNPTTSIEFKLPVKSFVSLVVYDVLGNEVATLVNEEKPAGFYEVNFNANYLVSGVYIYRLQANSFIETKKMILLR